MMSTPPQPEVQASDTRTAATLRMASSNVWVPRSLTRGVGLRKAELHFGREFVSSRLHTQQLLPRFR